MGTNKISKETFRSFPVKRIDVISNFLLVVRNVTKTKRTKSEATGPRTGAPGPAVVGPPKKTQSAGQTGFCFFKNQVSSHNNKLRWGAYYL
jgi:hypothetical protein